MVKTTAEYKSELDLKWFHQNMVDDRKADDAYVDCFDLVEFLSTRIT